ncbi:phosphoadenylyl-sulfate reductase [Cesiribacter sp. SM1]|uniref:phosphoadenylyl-sulfate reductase n=1 Tax=Cesiribacter sp. SM1 TaxID=2861196 RepID=UPI001CD2CEFF|nr:phosphoadenylyl-sulfate reductase [Cesiribacter sp. SM1]
MIAEIDLLNERFDKLTPEERLKDLFNVQDEKKILFTSSFGSTAVVLLHMLSRVKPGMPVYFLDTGYHFKQTLDYKNQVAAQLNLNIIDVKAEERKFKFTSENETWRYNQDLCCYINKVRPVEELQKNYDVWVSGLLRFQNANRVNMKVWERKQDILKFHPIIDMTQEEVMLYMQIWDLPMHPLVEEGYDSIGCLHCTAKGSGRSGRWKDSAKTECGLHI